MDAYSRRGLRAKMALVLHGILRTVFGPHRLLPFVKLLLAPGGNISGARPGNSHTPHGGMSLQPLESLVLLVCFWACS